MAGLAAGIRLRLGGKTVIIVERHEAPGGLNSFYNLQGRKYDVGLHAMTNYVPAGVKGTPLGKLFRQLRIPRDAFDLSEQCSSRIQFPGAELRFSNDFTLLESEIDRTFPDQIDGFRQLTGFVKSFDATNLDAAETPARPVLAKFLTDPLLVDMLCCPIFYYGSAREDDIDLGQFVIMFQSLFLEGFARPFAGVRQIIRALTKKYAELGGIRKMRLGVKQIQTYGNRAQTLELDDGSILSAEQVISTIGLVETNRLAGLAQGETDNIGKLSFVECIQLFEEQPRNLGWEDTIIFFNTSDTFEYRRPAIELVDPGSGVICFPNNYQYPDGKTLDEGWLRVTAIAHYDRWCALEEIDYQQAKRDWYEILMTQAVDLLPDIPAEKGTFADLCGDIDMFSPRTITKFTGHLGGAVYGAPYKRKDGRTDLDNVYIAGTDQGFLGIVGAMLSGISIANAYCLGGR